MWKCTDKFIWQVERVWGRDKNYNGKSRVNREMLKSRNNHENEERLCTEWLWCSVLHYTARLGMTGLQLFKLFSWMQTGLVPGYTCLRLLLSVLQLIPESVDDESEEYFRKFIANNWLQPSPTISQWRHTQTVNTNSQEDSDTVINS